MEKVQARGEKKICVDHVNIRISIAFLVMKLIVADILITTVLVAGYYLLVSTNAFEIIQIDSPVFAFGTIVILTVIESLFGIYIVLHWVSEYYEISPYAVVHKKGVFFKKEDRYGLHNIKQVVLEQGVFGKLLNYGTLNLFDWRLSKCAELYAVHNPMRYIRILEELLPNVDQHRATIRTSFGEDEDEDISA